MAKAKAKASCYLKSSHMSDAGKSMTFVFNPQDALETAKIDLMSREINGFEKVLLDVTVTVSSNNNKQCQKGVKSGSSKKAKNGEGSFAG